MHWSAFHAEVKEASKSHNTMLDMTWMQVILFNWLIHIWSGYEGRIKAKLFIQQQRRQQKQQKSKNVQRK